MSNELVVMNDLAVMPVMDLSIAKSRRSQIVQFVQTIMVKDTDFGVIPGTDKPTLLKPGAEKLATFFGLTKRFEIIERVEDFTGKDHNGEAFFYYLYRCALWRGDFLIAESDGSCSSFESKYRWRKAERVCPNCGQPNIRKSKQGEGWYCWQKTGGCGATFNAGNKTIESQEVGRVPNPDVIDQVNTIQKMAQKRCLAGSTPLLFKTGRSICRTSLKSMYEIYETSNDPLYLPGIDGTWREVQAMEKLDNRKVVRIDLADGSIIRATPEHRFPTPKGLVSVSELVVGDTLLRSKIDLPDERGALADIGWVVGLFIAEGHFSTDTCIRYTLNVDESHFVDRIINVAKLLGSTVSVKQQLKTNVLRVAVFGPGFSGIIRQFVQGDYSSGKHLHRACWSQGYTFLSSVFEGYLDGDGSWTEREGRNSYWRIGFTQENTVLADDLRTLCAIFDYRINLTPDTSKINGDKEYPTFVGWIKQNIKTYNQKDLDGIVSITLESRSRVVYDIQVDGDHLFCLANGIQTHNSLIAATLLAVNASEFFTQDLDDFIDAEYTSSVTEVTPPPVTVKQPRQVRDATPVQPISQPTEGHAAPNGIPNSPKQIIDAVTKAVGQDYYKAANHLHNAIGPFPKDKDLSAWADYLAAAIAHAEQRITEKATG